MGHKKHKPPWPPEPDDQGASTGGSCKAWGTRQRNGDTRIMYRSLPLGDTGAREHNRGKLKMMPTDWDDAEGEWVDGTHQERG